MNTWYGPYGGSILYHFLNFFPCESAFHSCRPGKGISLYCAQRTGESSAAASTRNRLGIMDGELLCTCAIHGRGMLEEDPGGSHGAWVDGLLSSTVVRPL